MCAPRYRLIKLALGAMGLQNVLASSRAERDFQGDRSKLRSTSVFEKLGNTIAEMTMVIKENQLQKTNTEEKEPEPRFQLNSEPSTSENASSDPDETPKPTPPAATGTEGQDIPNKVPPPNPFEMAKIEQEQKRAEEHSKKLHEKRERRKQRERKKQEELRRQPKPTNKLIVAIEQDEPMIDRKSEKVATSKKPRNKTDNEIMYVEKFSFVKNAEIVVSKPPVAVPVTLQFLGWSYTNPEVTDQMHLRTLNFNMIKIGSEELAKEIKFTCDWDTSRNDNFRFKDLTSKNGVRYCGVFKDTGCSPSVFTPMPESVGAEIANYKFPEGDEI